MSKKIVYEIKDSECVGDSVSKHNYNVLSLDTEICNLSSTFFSVENNYFNVFSDLCANIDSFNKFADSFFQPIDIAEAATATQFLSSYWEKNEITLSYPINIYDQGIYGQSKIYINDQTSNDLLAQYAAVFLNRTYSPTLLEQGTIANVVFLLYSNTGRTTQTEDVSIYNASGNNRQITEFKNNGRYVVPRGINNISVVVVGGGGGGGRGKGGGGGGGGVAYDQNLTVSENQTFNITVGAGGGPRSNGGISRFGDIIANGGLAGKDGVEFRNSDASGGAGGTASGGRFTTLKYNGATGGLGEIEGSASIQGSDGVTIDILNKTFSGGGGGGGLLVQSDNIGGLGGGGKGGGFGNITGTSGTPNTGGGGGGGGGTNGRGGSGGKGIVIVAASQSTSNLQTKRYYNVTQRKEDVYISRVKIARFIISPNKNWIYLESVQ